MTAYRRVHDLIWRALNLSSSYAHCSGAPNTLVSIFYPVEIISYQDIPYHLRDWLNVKEPPMCKIIKSHARTKIELRNTEV